MSIFKAIFLAKSNVLKKYKGEKANVRDLRTAFIYVYVYTCLNTNI